MRQSLKTLAESVKPHGHHFALWMFIQERIAIREKEANLNPDEIDLNPHLLLVDVADKVLADCKEEGFRKEEGFEEGTREDVYLLWLTSKVFHEAVAK